MSGRLAIAAVGLLLAGKGPPSTFIRSVDTESEKAVAVVSDPRFDDHSPKPVTEKGLSHALMASGFFHDEDVEALAKPLATELANMDRREQIRILAWGPEGIRRYYLWIKGRSLVTVYYRGEAELERSKAVIPDTEEGVPIATPVDASAATPASTTAAAGTPSDAVLAARSATPAATALAVATAKAAASPAPTKQVLLAMADIPPRMNESDVRDKLGELKQLHDQGLLTRDEYKKKVKDTLNRL